jgi:hypothetical protein
VSRSSSNDVDTAVEPAWQRNPVFKFFSSVKLAMLLLAVLIIAIIVGTLYESSFDARVARAYIYGALWFNVWLLLLVINLACSAFSRMPWKKHHTGFLMTHLGIITIIAGAFIGRTWGIEGTMTIFKGDRPSNALLVDQRALQIMESDTRGQSVPLEIIHRKPTPEKPWKLATTASGYQIYAVNYAPLLEMDMTPKAVSEGGVPAAHVSISTAMMGQTLQSWLMADNGEHGVFNMGLATVQFKRGEAKVDSATIKEPAAASAVTPAEGQAVDIEEAIFVFAKTPQQVSKALKGGTTGAQAKLVDVSKETNGKVIIDYQGTSNSFDVASNLGKEVSIPGTPYTLTIKSYWPDFRIDNGAPTSISNEPNNPSVLLSLRGHAVPAASAPEQSTAMQAPPMTGDSSKNKLTIFIDDKGELSYELSSRKAGTSSGKLEAGKPIATGWADWQLKVDQVIPQAAEHFTAQPVAKATGKGSQSEGVRIRATRGNESYEEWAPLGWQISLPTQPNPLRVSYDFRQEQLPIGLQLKEFQVDRDEGTETPAGFKSTVEITNMEGESVTGQCWMNNPISYPDSWLNTFSGLTYKISQASWNPENLGQSTVQILRDPGWSLKWIGSLCMVIGIFSLFYLRPYPDDLKSSKGKQSKARKSKMPVREPVSV